MRTETGRSPDFTGTDPDALGTPVEFVHFGRFLRKELRKFKLDSYVDSVVVRAQGRETRVEIGGTARPTRIAYDRMYDRLNFAHGDAEVFLRENTIRPGRSPEITNWMLCPKTSAQVEDNTDVERLIVQATELAVHETMEMAVIELAGWEPQGSRWAAAPDDPDEETEHDRAWNAWNDRLMSSLLWPHDRQTYQGPGAMDRSKEPSADGFFTFKPERVKFDIAF